MHATARCPALSSWWWQETGLAPLHTTMLLKDPAARDQMLTYLIEAGASIDAPDKAGRTVLMMAADTGDLGFAGKLLEARADIDAADRVHTLHLSPLSGR